MSIERWAVAGVLCALAAAIVGPPAARFGLWFGVLAGAACLAAAPAVAGRLPEALDGARRRRPVVAALWALGALVALLQVGRLSLFMADPARTWGSAFPDPKATDHMCMAAYVQAADLARRGEPNIYEERFYPTFTRDKPGGESPVRGLGPYLQDAYEYPPPFLLLPRMALALTNDFLALRAVWFVLRGLALLAGMVLLARWIGGREGRLAMLLAPLVFASLPTMLDLQFGQFHFTTVLLSVGAMVAFAERRPALGGALLGFAIVSKIFPGLLLVLLFARRRWRELAYTVGFAAAYGILALAVLGPAPFVAFFTYQLPRIASGAAFSFFLRDPFFISRNVSVYGVVFKLRELGVPGMTRGVASALSWLYTVVLVWLAWRAARVERTRLGEAQLWLALLTLAALRSPLAPSAYAVAPILWLLTLLAGRVRGAAGVIGYVVLWQFIMGFPPLPGVAELLVSMLGQALCIGFCLWVAWAERRGKEPHEMPRLAGPGQNRGLNGED